MTSLSGVAYLLNVTEGRRGRVLVTGATGFVAGHCILDLLARGYDVRGTVRNLPTADVAHLRPAIEQGGGAFELAVVHPGAVIGPPLLVKRDSSADIVRRMLAGEMPAIPPLHLAFTDVRDLAAGHRLALEVPAAKGNRYILANGQLPMTGIAAILKEEYGPRGYKISTRPLPAWVLRTAALVSGEAKLGADMLGIPHDVSAQKAMRELGWTARPLRESVLDTAESLISAGIVGPRKPVSAG